MKGTTRTFLIVLAMATILATVTMGGAVARKCEHGNNPHCSGSGSSGSGGTISLVLLNSTDGQAHWGQLVTFDISTTATDQPWVNLQCYQNGALVAQGWEGFFDGSLSDRIFGLYSQQWTGGEADCTAYLDTPQWTALASTSFHVYA
jgi:hypothetical protein